MIRSHFIKLNVPLFLKQLLFICSVTSQVECGGHAHNEKQYSIPKEMEGREVEGRIRVEESFIFKTH